MKLEQRMINGKVSDTHFLYTDKNGREWSVVDFELFMTKPPLGEFVGGKDFAELFGYVWEGMHFSKDGQNLQVRAMTQKGILNAIEDI